MKKIGRSVNFWCLYGLVFLTGYLFFRMVLNQEELYWDPSGGFAFKKLLDRVGGLLWPLDHLWALFVWTVTDYFVLDGLSRNERAPAIFLLLYVICGFVLLVVVGMVIAEWGGIGGITY